MAPATLGVVLEPTLEPAEVRFLAAFAEEREIRRVWPGQPSSCSPWRPSADGRWLELDEARAQTAPESVAPWLRFLSRTFLAPSTPTALDAALRAGLRAGHQLAGTVVVGDLEVTIDFHRVTERRVPQPETPAVSPSTGAVVVDLDSRRGLPGD